VTDLSTGEVFEDLPILRVCFCDETTASLMPAQLWRGRFTVSSVLETVVHVLDEGVAGALIWTGFAATDEELVSERTLRRWRDGVRKRLVGSALAWLGPKLGLEWSDSIDAATQLDRIHDRLNGLVLLEFRTTFGHAVLDRSAPHPSLSPRSPARRVVGPLAEAPPPDPPSSYRARGRWSPRTGREGRGPPVNDPTQEEPQ